MSTVKDIKKKAANKGRPISNAEAVKRAEQSSMDKIITRMPVGRRAPRIKGRGDFFQDFFEKGDLAKAGNWLGRGLGRALGFGDYTIKRNSLFQDAPRDGYGNMTKDFSFSESGSSIVRVRKREYIGSVVAPAVNPENFTQVSYRLQVTDSSTFPWLSAIGNLYTEYEIKGAIVSFDTTSSNYSATVGLGTIAIATQYNANMLPYADMDSILQSAYHTKGNPSENLLHGIECDPQLQASERLFTRRPGAQGPANLYDHGVFYVATEGLPSGAAGVVLGRVYLTYDIELSLPELPVVSPWASDAALSTYQATTSVLPPLGPSLTMAADNDSTMTISSASGSNILLLSGAAGPIVKPDLAAADENELCAWFNDNSSVVTEQYLSFARAGKYWLTIMRWIPGNVGYNQGDTTVVVKANTTLSDPTFVNKNATDGLTMWSWLIDVRIAGGSVVIGNASAASGDSIFQLLPC